MLLIDYFCKIHPSLCFPHPLTPFCVNFSDVHMKWSEVKSVSRVRLFATPWTVACQAPLSMAFSRQEYWSGLPFPSPGDLPDPGIEPWSPALEADTLTSEPPGKRCAYSRYLIFAVWISYFPSLKLFEACFSNNKRAYKKYKRQGLKQDLNVNQASVSRSLIFTSSCLTVKQIGMSCFFCWRGSIGVMRKKRWGWSLLSGCKRCLSSTNWAAA